MTSADASERPKSREEKDYSAQKLLEIFPAELKGAATIEKVIHPPDAKYCLVIVRQMHPPPNTEEDAKTVSQKLRQSAGYGQSVTPVQRDVYGILLDLSHRFGPLKVYREGLPAGKTDTVTLLTGMEKNQRRLTREEAELREKITYLEAQSSADDKLPLPEMKEKLQMLQKTIALQKEKIAAALPDVERNDLALGYLAQAGQAEITGAENTTVLLQIDELTAQIQALEFQSRTERNPGQKSIIDDRCGDLKMQREHLIMEGREDALIQLVRKDGNPAAITVFGGSHDWKNNVEDWNKDHPEEQFGLIVITPKAYARAEEEQKAAQEIMKKKK